MKNDEAKSEEGRTRKVKKLLEKAELKPSKSSDDKKRYAQLVYSALKEWGNENPS